MPHEGVQGQREGAVTGVGGDAVMTTEKPARRTRQQPADFLSERAKRADQPAAQRERPSEGAKEARKGARSYD